MNRRRIRIRGGGHIRIDGKWLSSFLDGAPPGEQAETSENAPGAAAPGPRPGISLGATVIERAQMVTEGVFRPGVEDVEVKYLMSGTRPDRIERVHTLASDRIIADATPVSVSTNVSQLIEFVKRSGAGNAGLIVDLHSHPSSGIALPSETDMKTWLSVARMLEEEFPNTRFLFGVHGVGRQMPTFVERTPPVVAGVNRVIWRSVTRDHEIALFAPDATPVEVYLDG